MKRKVRLLKYPVRSVLVAKGPEPSCAVIGFELRPSYSVVRFGKDDVVHVRYVIKNRKIVVYLELNPAIELHRES